MAKKNLSTIEEKLAQLKEIFNSDVVVTLGVQKKTGKVDLLNCERSMHLSPDDMGCGFPSSPSKKLLDKFPPSYLG